MSLLNHIKQAFPRAILLAAALLWGAAWGIHLTEQACEEYLDTLDAPQSVSMPPRIDEDALEVLWVLRDSRWPCTASSCLSDPVGLWDLAQLLTREAHDNGLEPRLVAGLVMVENPWLDPEAVSHAGAVGLLQVMPRYWDGIYADCGDLDTMAGNACYGVRILRYYMDRHNDDYDRALLAYNGCRAHWSSCNWYPTRVLSKGGLR